MPDPRAWLVAVGSCDWPGENGDEDDLPAGNSLEKKVDNMRWRPNKPFVTKGNI